MKNNTINYQNPLKTQHKQSKQVSQVNFTPPPCSVNYPLTTVRLEGSYSNPLGFFLRGNSFPRRTPGRSRCVSPAPAFQHSSPGPLTHPGLPFSSPLQPVGEEVKVTPLPLSQERVPQLEHVSMHDTVLPQGII